MQTMSQLPLNQARTAMMLAQSLRSTQIPLGSMVFTARLYHHSAFLQDKSSTSSPASRPQQSKPRRSFFWQRRDRKEARNRISTLAVDPNATSEADTQGTYQGQQSDSKDETNGGNSRYRLMSRNQRNMLLFTVVLSIPIIGRDVMEFVVPGLLGTIIFVGSKIKSGIKWVRRIGSADG